VHIYSISIIIYTQIKSKHKTPKNRDIFKVRRFS